MTRSGKARIQKYKTGGIRIGENERTGSQYNQVATASKSKKRNMKWSEVKIMQWDEKKKTKI